MFTLATFGFALVVAACGEDAAIHEVPPVDETSTSTRMPRKDGGASRVVSSGGSDAPDAIEDADIGTDAPDALADADVGTDAPDAIADADVGTDAPDAIADADVGTDAPAPEDAGPEGPPMCSQQFLDETQIAKAAFLLNRCGFSDDGIYRTTTYLRGIQGGFEYQPGAVACLAALSGPNACSGVLACTGYAYRPYVPAACSTCEGSVAVRCFSGQQYETDCAKKGATCSNATCVRPGDPPCPYEGALSCDVDGRVRECDNKTYAVRKGADCDQFGLACVSGRCVVPDAGLSIPSSYFDVGTFGTSCSGSFLSLNTWGGSTKVDCRCFGPGFSCQSMVGTSGPVFFCGAAAECRPNNQPAVSGTCPPGPMKICNAGKWMTFDCTSLGY